MAATWYVGFAKLVSIKSALIEELSMLSIFTSL
jgi:hypothetical protein